MCHLTIAPLGCLLRGLFLVHLLQQEGRRRKDFVWTEKTSVIRQQHIYPSVYLRTAHPAFLLRHICNKSSNSLLPSQPQPRKDYEAFIGKSEWMRLKHQIVNPDVQDIYLLHLPIISLAMPSICSTQNSYRQNEWKYDDIRNTLFIYTKIQSQS